MCVRYMILERGKKEGDIQNGKKWDRNCFFSKKEHRWFIKKCEGNPWGVSTCLSGCGYR